MKKKQNLSELARRHGTSRETIRRWESEGVNLNDAAALAARAARKRGTPPAEAGGLGETFTEARRRKMIADADRAEAAAARERGDVVAVDAVHRAAHVTHTILRALLRSLENYLPEALHGLEPGAINSVLRHSFDELLQRVGDQEFFDAHPAVVKRLAELEALDARTLCRGCRRSLES